MIRILVFGDSIAYGAWDSQGGWADRLKQYYHKQSLASDDATKVQVMNLGIGGNNSSHIRDRVRAEIEFRVKDDWETVLVFSFGTNDARIRDDAVVTTAQRFRDNVKDIALIAQAYSDRTMFVGPPPISLPELTNNNSQFSDSLLHQYDQELISIVEKAGFAYVPTREVYERHGLDGLYTKDGLHPSDEGHKLIFDVVRPELDKLLQ